MPARVRFASMLRTAVSGLRSHFDSRDNAICRRIHNIRRDADASSCIIAILILLLRDSGRFWGRKRFIIDHLLIPFSIRLRITM